MPYCPKCRMEYRDGFTKCNDCDIDLVEVLNDKEQTQEEKKRATVGKVKPQPDLGNEVSLVTVDNQVEYVYITSELELQNIPYRVMERDAGQYLTIYMGVSYMGRTIYVDKNDYEKAKGIVDSIKAEFVETGE